MACIPVLQNVRTSLDQKMMHNVNTAVQQADALLVIVDATSNLAEVLEMPGMAPGWSGPPAALVSPVRTRCCGRGTGVALQITVRLQTVTLGELSCARTTALVCLLMFACKAAADRLGTQVRGTTELVFTACS